MKKNKLLFIFLLLLLLFSKMTVAATSVTITASTSSICLPSSGDFTVTITVHIKNPPAGAYSIHWFRKGSDIHTDNFSGGLPTDSTFDFTYLSSVTNYSSPQNWYVEIREAGNPVIITTSPTI